MHSGKYDVYITVGTGYLNFGFVCSAVHKIAF